MNKVIGIIIFRGNALINRFIDTSWANFLIRRTVENEIVDSCKSILKFIDYGKVVSIDFKSESDKIEYLSNVMCYCYKKNGMSSVILTKDYKYPRIIIELIYKLIDEYDDVNDNDLEQIARQYENPTSVDKLVKTQDELEKTREILNTTIDKILERGVRIEDLVEKTNDLELESKIFFQRAERLNSCCNIL